LQEDVIAPQHRGIASPRRGAGGVQGHVQPEDDDPKGALGTLHRLVFDMNRLPSEYELKIPVAVPAHELLFLR
jgi:hypothetical protein